MQRISQFVQAQLSAVSTTFVQTLMHRHAAEAAVYRCRSMKPLQPPDAHNTEPRLSDGVGLQRVASPRGSGWDLDARIAPSAKGAVARGSSDNSSSPSAAATGA